MMYNTRYLPENFEQCRLDKTILRQFPYNLNVRSSRNALIQDGGKYHERAYRIGLVSRLSCLQIIRKFVCTARTDCLRLVTLFLKSQKGEQDLLFLISDRWYYNPQCCLNLCPLGYFP